jgi:hypothetical protein
MNMETSMGKFVLICIAFVAFIGPVNADWEGAAVNKDGREFAAVLDSKDEAREGARRFCEQATGSSCKAVVFDPSTDSYASVYCARGRARPDDYEEVVSEHDAFIATGESKEKALAAALHRAKAGGFKEDDCEKHEGDGLWKDNSIKESYIGVAVSRDANGGIFAGEFRDNRANDGARRFCEEASRSPCKAVSVDRFGQPVVYIAYCARGSEHDAFITTGEDEDRARAAALRRAKANGFEEDNCENSAMIWPD